MNWDNVEFAKASGGLKLYTGPCAFKVVGVNPNQEELSEILGIDVEKLKERDYSNRLDIYLRNDEHDITTKTSIFLDADSVVSRTGKPQYMNKYCQDAYIENIEDVSELDWFSRDGARNARGGEASLYKFFVNWINADTSKGTFELPFEEFLAGDLSSFVEAIERFKDNEIIGMLGVSNKKYQEVYSRDFARGSRKNWSKIKWDKDFSTEFKEYIAPQEPDALESALGASSTNVDDTHIPF